MCVERTGNAGQIVAVGIAGRVMRRDAYCMEKRKSIEAAGESLCS